VPPHGAWHKVWTALGKARRAQKRARMRTWYDPWGPLSYFLVATAILANVGQGGLRVFLRWDRLVILREPQKRDGAGRGQNEGPASGGHEWMWGRGGLRVFSDGHR
jgi:hypothetical protein